MSPCWRVGSLAAIVSLLATTAAAEEDAPPLDPEQVVTGIADPGREEGDTARDVGNVLLWLPRNVIDYTFRGTSAAARFVANENLVPRYRQWVGAPLDGDFFVFPTFFAETGSAFSVGVRMITDSPRVTTSHRFGFGGLRDVVAESRVLFKGTEDLPFAISLEGYYELESSIDYHGIGLRPRLDGRNSFRVADRDYGEYTERHVRTIGSLGMRLTDNLEIFQSVSLYRREVFEPKDSEGSLSDVFGAGSIAGAYVPGDPSAGRNTWMVYAEMAARFDSRRYRGRPSTGALVEGYSGGARSVTGDRVAFMRVGGRAAGFIPIYRDTNILSPRIVIDRLIPLNDLEVPFNEIPTQPDFRGFDYRRDNFSVVMSLDYTWQVADPLSLRTFLDAATVAPSVASFSLQQIKSMRFAGGLGIDFYTKTATLARLGLAMSGDGPRLSVSVGAPEGFGDRQHRD
ncbi:MAG: hypothetical protein R3B72_08700 [Polyangiaceae bacterium]